MQKITLVGRALLGGFWLLISALKEASGDIKINSALLVSLLGKVAWAIPLTVVPHLFNTFPTYYGAFRQVWPEWVWAVVVVILIAADALAIALKLYEMQIICLFAGIFTWGFFSAMVSQGVPHGWAGLPATPAAYLYTFGAIGCTAGMYRTARAHGAMQEAQRSMLLAGAVEKERDAGQHWAQEILPIRASASKIAR
jgi:hypothetical protein